MCGRYHVLTDISRLADRFAVRQTTLRLEPLYNLAPTEEGPIVIAGTPRQLVLRRFGLEASWMDKPLINIRAESFAQKPFFQRYLKERRCLIPADGFYEWKKGPTGSVPYRFTLKNQEAFGFAGVCDDKGFAIITTEGNALAAEIHNRMPVIVRPEEEAVWLDSDMKDLHRLMPLLAPYPAEAMVKTQVSRAVSSSRNKSADCIAPA